MFQNKSSYTFSNAFSKNILVQIFLFNHFHYLILSILNLMQNILALLYFFSRRYFHEKFIITCLITQDLKLAGPCLVQYMLFSETDSNPFSDLIILTTLGNLISSLWNWNSLKIIIGSPHYFVINTLSNGDVTVERPITISHLILILWSWLIPDFWTYVMF